jgi:hypothetical protein
MYITLPMDVKPDPWVAGRLISSRRETVEIIALFDTIGRF